MKNKKKVENVVGGGPAGYRAAYTVYESLAASTQAARESLLNALTMEKQIAVPKHQFSIRALVHLANHAAMVRIKWENYMIERFGIDPETGKPPGPGR